MFSLEKKGTQMMDRLLDHLTDKLGDFWGVLAFVLSLTFLLCSTIAMGLYYTDNCVWYTRECYLVEAYTKTGTPMYVESCMEQCKFRREKGDE